jgi:hypothetical protein
MVKGHGAGQAAVSEGRPVIGAVCHCRRLIHPMRRGRPAGIRVHHRRMERDAVRCGKEPVGPQYRAGSQEEYGQ